MAKFKVIAALAAAASAVVSVAQAADMPPLPMPPPIQRAPAMSEDYSSGWYLRGDVGYRFNRIGRADAATPFLDPSRNDIAKGIAYGGGGGFKAGWVRADLTVDYAPDVKYTGLVATPGDVTAKISSIAGLFNLYFDLGTWYGFTPYLGAGVGTAYVRTANYVSAVAPPFANVPANARWNLAWAGMLGATYSFTRNLALDVGYRYLNLGNAETASDGVGRMAFKSLGAHEVRLGVRWMFNDPFPIQ